MPLIPPFGEQPGLRLVGLGRIRPTAHEIGVTYRQLYNPLHGWSRPRQAVRDRLPAHLGVPLDDLFTPEALALENRADVWEARR